MLNFLKDIFFRYLNVFTLLFTVSVSVIIISFNKYQSIKDIRVIATGNFALVNYIDNYFTSIFNSDVKFEKMRRLNAELMLKLNRLNYLNEQNAQLKNLLKLESSLEYEFEAAEIISKNLSGVNGIFTLNKGELNGIESGMPVIDENGLIGIIDMVDEDVSVVKALSNSNLRIASKISKSGYQGILKWSGSELQINNIPSNINISYGDSVVTSDFSTLFPPEIPLGFISDVRKNISGILSNVSVEPYTNLRKTKYVFILKLTNNVNLRNIADSLSGAN